MSSAKIRGMAMKGYVSEKEKCTNSPFLNGTQPADFKYLMVGQFNCY